jgi:type II secretory pathway pseudopilin PulG
MKQTERGMTFIEAMVWIALMVAAMTAIASTVMYFYRTNAYSLEQSTAVTSAQRGLEKMVRTIREAAFSSQGAYPIVSVSPHDFVFYADVDDDPLIERVHYYLTGSTLMRGILNPSGDPPDYVGTETTEAVADYVRNLSVGSSTFRYYDALGAEVASSTTAYTAVRFVKVTLGINVNIATLPSQLSLYSSAALRNLIAQ